MQIDLWAAILLAIGVFIVAWLIMAGLVYYKKGQPPTMMNTFNRI